jgi:predicted house-cleaning noncanonical NTP pyrophosphatase (MazG superfamily)
VAARVDLKPAPTGYPIKLVRDGTPEVLNGSGEPGELFYGPLRGDRMRWLRLKLAEEAGEYLVDGGIEELADVLAVVTALSEAHGVRFSELLARAAQHPRGGFADAVMMYGRHPEFDQPAEQGRSET